MERKEWCRGMKGGLSFLDILTLEFIGFKLAGCIDWSWILVFAPLGTKERSVWCEKIFCRV